MAKMGSLKSQTHIHIVPIKYLYPITFRLENSQSTPCLPYETHPCTINCQDHWQKLRQQSCIAKYLLDQNHVIIPFH